MFTLLNIWFAVFNIGLCICAFGNIYSVAIMASDLTNGCLTN